MGPGLCSDQRFDRAADPGLGDLLAERGYKSGLTPATRNFDEVKLMARWSHKHLAHLVNLGRFGSHHMLITPVGGTGRLGSLVTEADLGDHPLIGTREACLLKAGKACGQCGSRLESRSHN